MIKLSMRTCIIAVVSNVQLFFIQQNQHSFEMNPKPKEKPSGSLSSYGKYKCQYKHKPILTKLSNDSGYPQGILDSSLPSSPRENNFVEENKKNLKNFFKERIPAENTLLNKLMKRESELINPKNIFEMKQIQYDLKSKTKINLQKEFESELQALKQSPFLKVNASFHINDKNKELKEKYGGKMNLSFYQENNHRKGTQSHIGKRSKTIKREAYDKVFGPDISSFSRTATFQPPNKEIASSPRVKSISLNASLNNSSENKNLRDLIGRMNVYKNKLEDRQQPSQMFAYQQEDEEKQYESNLITMMKKMTKSYHGKNISQGYQKLEKLEDLGKIYKEYYACMQNHKSNRLNVRMQLVNRTITFANNDKVPSPPFASFQLEMDNQSIISFNEIGEPFQTNAQYQMQASLSQGPVHSVKNRFKLLKKTLVRWAALFYLYGIKRKDIFIAFRANKEPYEIEGSYVFFKCIKMGDLASVKDFISKNSSYIFETQSNGRSPLSYACIYNQVQIAEFIIAEGVNSDKLCNNKKTSLFYALTTRNVELIKLLLQKGASPWSTPENPYSSMLKTGKNATQIENLFCNSRKIYLGMQIQSTILQRKQFWFQNKGKITERYRLTYNS